MIPVFDRAPRPRARNPTSLVCEPLKFHKITKLLNLVQTNFVVVQLTRAADLLHLYLRHKPEDQKRLVQCFRILDARFVLGIVQFMRALLF